MSSTDSIDGGVTGVGVTGSGATGGGATGGGVTGGGATGGGVTGGGVTSGGATGGGATGGGLSRVAVAGAVSCALVLVALVLWSYRFRPTPATLFLVGGGLSIVACAWFLLRAVAAYDPSRPDEGQLLERLGDREIEELEREKKILLKAIKEVEFDAATGKVDEDDAAESIARYRARALEVLKLLDRARPVDYVAKVETELAARMAKAGGPLTVAAPGAASAPRVARRVCPSCQTTNDADATFCKKCGTRLHEAEAAG